MNKDELRRLQLPPLEEIMSQVMNATPDVVVEERDKTSSCPANPEYGKRGVDYLRAGIKLAENGNFEVALAYLDLAIRMAPGCFSSYKARAELRRLTGNVYGSNQDEKLAKTLEPNHEFIANLRAGDKHDRKLASYLMKDVADGCNKLFERYGPGFEWET